MNYRSVNDLHKHIINNLHRIPRDVDLVVGVPRSGLLVANLIALHLNLPLSDLDGYLSGKIFESGKTRRRSNYTESLAAIQKVLIVEDSISSGDSIKEVKNKILNSKIANIEFIYLAAYVAPKKEYLVDIYLDICELPRVFEWNIIHHNIIEDSCFDLDGVLCVDPTKDEDDDGEKYIDFLNTAKPLFIPSKKINSIVTCRLEKYRPHTEYWLKQNGIEYENLYMMSYSSKEERMKSGKHAQYKAKHYKGSNCKLFIESNLNQALEISKITKKPVYCTEVREMIYPNHKIKENYFGTPNNRLVKIKKKIPISVKVIIKSFFNCLCLKKINNK